MRVPVGKGKMVQGSLGEALSLLCGFLGFCLVSLCILHLGVPLALITC
jgi:hypothetical protein